LGVSTRISVHISNVSNSEHLHDIKQADFQNLLDLKAMATEFQPNCPVTPVPEFIFYMTINGGGGQKTKKM
jgi:hypothetical protein